MTFDEIISYLKASKPEGKCAEHAHANLLEEMECMAAKLDDTEWKIPQRRRTA